MLTAAQFDHFWYLNVNKTRVKEREHIFCTKCPSEFVKQIQLVFAVSWDLDWEFRSLFKCVCECKVNPCQNRPLHVFIIFIQLMIALIISLFVESQPSISPNKVHNAQRGRP